MEHKERLAAEAEVLNELYYKIETAIDEVKGRLTLASVIGVLECIKQETFKSADLAIPEVENDPEEELP